MTKYILIGIFFISNSLVAQTKDNFLNDLKRSINSYSNLQQVLLNYKKDSTNWVQPTTNFFDCNSYFNVFIFKNPFIDSEHPVYALTVLVYYKNNNVVYISVVLKGENWSSDEHKYLGDDTLFRYIDHNFSDSALLKYNNENNTEFTWRDLFEDTYYNEFSLIPGCCGPYFLTEETKPFLILLKEKNKDKIIQNCKSFNSVRKVFGAVCLYFLQVEGTILSQDEIEILKSIKSSNDLIHWSWACSGYEEKIKEMFAHYPLEECYKDIKRGIDKDYDIKRFCP